MKHSLVFKCILHRFNLFHVYNFCGFRLSLKFILKSLVLLEPIASYNWLISSNSSIYNLIIIYEFYLYKTLLLQNKVRLGLQTITSRATSKFLDSTKSLTISRFPIFAAYRKADSFSSFVLIRPKFLVKNQNYFSVQVI